MISAGIGQNPIWGSKEQKLFGVIVDRDMKFVEYILKQCKKTRRKLCAFGKITYAIYRIPAYCPLAWIFCRRSSNNLINHLQERAVRIIYNIHSSTFEDLLVKDNSVSIHHGNIHLLATELYKAKNNLTSKMMLELLQSR